MNAAAATLTPSSARAPHSFRAVAAYFLIMALPESLLALAYYYVCFMFFYITATTPPLDPRDPDYSPSSGITGTGIMVFLFIGITAGFFLLPGYWKSFRSRYVSKRFWILSLAYNSFWTLLIFLLLVCSLFTLVNYFGDTSDIHDRLLCLTPFFFALVGSALSAYCVYTYKSYAPSPPN